MLGFKRFHQKKEEDPDVHVPHAGPEHDFEGDLYHGTPTRHNRINPTKTQGKGLPEPEAVSYATKKETAAQFGKHIFHLHTKARVGDAELFMKRARQHMRRGLHDNEASRKTQEEFRSKGYHGIRWGNREVALWDRHEKTKYAGEHK